MPAIDTSAIRITPGQASAGHRDLSLLEIVQRVDGPAYLMRETEGPALTLSAVTGRPEPMLTREGAAAAAQMFCGCRTAGVVGPYDFDQWIVHQKYNPYRPFYRVGLVGPTSERLYVSAGAGEVFQRTTREQRVLNYVGSVVHWIYPTVLRRYPSFWSWSVWAVSLVGLTTAVAGLWLGIARSRASLRNRRGARISPFKGLLRWHHLLGLGVGTVLIAWILSGWLSVDHGLLFPTGNPSLSEIKAFRESSLPRAASGISLPLVRSLRGMSELRVDAVGGETFLSGYQR